MQCLVLTWERVPGGEKGWNPGGAKRRWISGNWTQLFDSKHFTRIRFVGVHSEFGAFQLASKNLPQKIASHNRFQASLKKGGRGNVDWICFAEDGKRRCVSLGNDMNLQPRHTLDFWTVCFYTGKMVVASMGTWCTTKRGWILLLSLPLIIPPPMHFWNPCPLLICFTRTGRVVYWFAHQTTGSLAPAKCFQNVGVAGEGQVTSMVVQMKITLLQE